MSEATDFTVVPGGLPEDADTTIRRLRQQIADLEASQHEPIAVIGMGCRLPGGVRTPEQFWAALSAGDELLEEVPADRWSNDTYHDSNADAQGKICTRRGGFIRDPDCFDAGLFRISPREAASMDPQQRILLEVAWEALEHAGIAPDLLYGSDAGVFMGLSALDYLSLMTRELDEAALEPWFGTGMAHSAASGRISYTLGLRGPSLSIDTACSSSLVATHLACESLRRQECGLALVGGINLMLSPVNHIVFSRAHMLAPDGRCKTFDARADGYVRSDGAAVVVLKRLSDALAAGDRIWALIRGGAVNQDGASGGLTVPHGPAQERVVRAALARARVDAAQVSYVEAHGTGTALGDPIELNALATVFDKSHNRARPLYVGSVKTNLGHAEPASGIIGLIKLALQLERGKLAPHLHCQEPTPRVAWDKLPLQIPTALTDWPRYGTERIGGVSSFGFTGTNAHLVLQEPPPSRAEPRGAADAELLCVSARTESALAELCERLACRLEASDAPGLGELCHSQNTAKAQLPYRRGLVAKTHADAVQLLRARPGAAVPVRQAPRVAFLFSGQGSQYTGMGRQLYLSSPVFRETLERCDAVLRREHGWSLVEALYGDPPSALLAQTRLAQPAILSIELALVALLQSWGVVPTFVMGHSLGEYAAACVADVLSLEDAVHLVARRAELMQALPNAGAMFAVQCPAAELEPLLASHQDSVSIAALNGSKQTVLSGSLESLEQIQAALTSRKVACRRLDVSHAFHSPLMRPMVEALRELCRCVTLRTPRIPLVSNLTGALTSSELCDPDYWVRHTLGTVVFRDGLQTLSEQGCDFYLEVGPRPTLLPMLRGVPQIPARAPRAATLDPARSDDQQLKQAAAKLFEAGVQLNFSTMQPALGQARVAVPSYPFQRDRHWYTSQKPVQTKLARGLLGSRVVDPAAEHAFEGELTTAQHDYLSDHRVVSRVVFPASGYVEIALSAARQSEPGAQTLALQNIQIEAPLELEPDEAKRLRISCQKSRFTIRSRDAQAPATDPGTQHASGTWLDSAGSAPPPLQLEAIAQRTTASVDVAALYDSTARGVSYGPRFRAIRALQCSALEVLGRIELDEELIASASDSIVHPVLLDAAFQSLAPLLCEHGAYLPVAIEAIELHAAPGHRATVHASLRPSSDVQGISLADLTLCDPEGRVTVVVRGLTLQRTSLPAIERALDGELGHLAYELSFTDQPLDAAALAPDRHWLIFADADGVGERLAATLTAADERCSIVQRADLAHAQRTGSARYAVDASYPEQITQLRSLLAEEPAFTASNLSIVYAWGLDAPALTSDILDALPADLFGCAPLQEIAVEILPRDGQLFVVTRGALATGRLPEPLSPSQAALSGTIATLRGERADTLCRHIDLDPCLERRTPTGETARLARELSASTAEDSVAFRAHERLVARLQHVPRADAPCGPVAVILDGTGSPDNLRFEPAARRPPQAGEIEIAVRAVGANFKDVLHIWGLLDSSVTKLGFECSGVVVDVGPGVSEHAIGDEVIGLGTECLSHFVTLPARAALPKPTRLSHVEAAALPTAFITAYHALHDLAQASPGESVLVHAAAGGVGQAIVRLCKRLGIQVFATASPSKWDLLAAQDIRHVHNSRSLEFREQILEQTNGRGVDIVINSLSGEFIPASLDVLAPGGRFVEIGKRGIWSAEDVHRKRPDARYYAFDLGVASAALAERLPDMLKQASQWLEAGQITALPVQVFPIERVRDAYRHLSQGKNVGKVVIELSSPTRSPQPVRDTGAYLVTGGLGALGLESAEWLVSQGARELWLCGRSEPSDATQVRLAALAERGVKTHVRRIDVTQGADLRKLLAEVAHTGSVLRGVIHAAGQLDDAMLEQQSRARCATVMAPKVLGAWNLHQLTRDQPLDFFMCFSSISALLPSPGQVSYAAANAFMDALMQMRRRDRLPALSIGWGAWSGSGMGARLPQALKAVIHQRGVRWVGARKNLRALSQHLGQPNAHVLVAALDWPSYARWRAPRAVQPYLELVAGELALGRRFEHSSLGAGALRNELERTAPHEREARLRAVITELITHTLGFSSPSQVDLRAGFFDLGIDSLSALEIKTRLEIALSHELPPTTLMSFPSVEALAEHLNHSLFAQENLAHAAE